MTIRRIISNKFSYILVVALTFTLIQQTQTRKGERVEVQFLEDDDILQQNILQNQQIKQTHKTVEQHMKSLPPHLVEQLQSLDQFKQVTQYESFSFYLQTQFQVKWNTPVEGQYFFRVNVFLFDGKDIILPQQPKQDQYVMVLGANSNSQNLLEIGKVYITRTMSINIFKNVQAYKLVFINHFGGIKQKIIIDIQAEHSGTSLKQGISDDKFKLSSQKMKIILQELEQTETGHRKLFLQEYSLMGRQQRNQSEMLILTGVELLVILGTAIIQIYCLKNLIDNRIIV